MTKSIIVVFFAALLMAAEPSFQTVEAIKKGDIVALRVAVTSKEDANAALPNGKTILMLSVWEKKPEIVKYLIEKGADINATDEGGKTPLMLAVWRENLEITKLLISNGSDKNIKNKEGLGISDIAELTGNGEIIDYIANITK